MAFVGEEFDVVVDIPNKPHGAIGAGYEVPADLELLSLINNRLKEITNLAHCTKLRKIVLRQNGITAEGLAGLEGAPSATLESLDLYENNIDGYGLGEALLNKLRFPVLRFLDLSFNPIRRIPRAIELDGKELDGAVAGAGPFSACPLVEEIYFVNCKLVAVPPVQCLPLHTLELGANRIRTIEGLNVLTSLRHLWLGKNKIEEIQGLETLTGLEQLSLQSNRLTKISGLETLTNLKELYLSENGLTALEGLSTLKQLTILDVASNQITSTAGLEGLDQLEELWINGNQLTGYEEVERLQGLPALHTVYLEHNKTLSHPQYRNKVLALLPRLQQIDARPVPKGAVNPLAMR
mmetsp:Transcript_8834/g.36612  ORF Transcript_8834/g.36612 Transcript_8834/m.36612 type:complete len:351 (-) Transcript_8834:106-1158(-)